MLNIIVYLVLEKKGVIDGPGDPVVVELLCRSESLQTCKLENEPRANGKGDSRVSGRRMMTPRV